MESISVKAHQEKTGSSGRCKDLKGVITTLCAHLYKNTDNKYFISKLKDRLDVCFTDTWVNVTGAYLDEKPQTNRS